MTGTDVRLRAFELGELFWEQDRLTLRALTPVQRQAQLKARERLLSHARRVQQFAQAGTIPTGDHEQRAAAAGMVELMQALFEHARDEHADASTPPTAAARVPIPAPAGIWGVRRPAPAVPQPARPAPTPEQRVPATPTAMMCRRCAGKLERSALATAMDRPMSQGWRHVDGRKTHLPDPVPARS